MFKYIICVDVVLVLFACKGLCKPQNRDVEKRFLFGHHHHDCKTLPTTANGKYTCPGAVVKDNQQCTLTCNEGYKVTGTPYTATCDNGNWKRHASCVVAMCPRPVAILPGKYTCSTALMYIYIHGTTCNLTCPVGYKINTGHPAITCQNSGTWSASPNCVEIRCPAPHAPPHGTLHCTPSSVHKMGSTCKLSCATGYNPSHSAISCTKYSTWTAASCLVIKCPAPRQPRHGVYKCSQSTYTLHVSCHLTCDTGFKVNASNRILCLQSSKWSTPGTCVEIKCPTPPKVSHGHYSCSHLTHKLNDKCQLNCDTGYRRSTTADITCQSSDKWTTAGTCIEIKCPAPPSVTHGVYMCAQTTHKLHDRCHLQCGVGYRPSLGMDIQCLDTDTWSTPSTCVEIRCPSLPKIMNGYYSCGHTTHSTYYTLNQKCSLHCTSGYKQSSSHSDITCMSPGTWSAPAACIAITCPGPPGVSYGEYRCAKSPPHKVHDICDLHCTSGFKSTATVSRITCESTGRWSSTPGCVEIRCPSPPVITNGIYKCPHTTSRKLNDVCLLQCSSGFKPSTTSSNITCLSTSQWSLHAVCVEIECPAPPKPSYGQYHCDHTVHKLGDVCHLHCNHGFKPGRPSTDISCLSTDQWSSSANCVEIKCPPSPSVANGAYICDHVPSKLNDVCHLQCNTGYKPSSSSSDIKCLSTDTWSTPVSCQVIRCPKPPSVSHGSYHCDRNTHHLKDQCHLHCDTGYKLSSSSSNITCLSSESWTTPASCLEIKCPDPPKVANGVYDCGTSPNRMNDVCHLKCGSGYKPSKSSSDISCLGTEKWSTPAACDEIQCPDPPVVANGTYYCGKSTTHKLHTVCHLQCVDGYKPGSNSTDIHCTATAKWSAPSTCIEIKCPTPPKLEHGMYHCISSDTHKIDDICYVQCNDGYKISSDHTSIHCLQTQKWSDPVTCSETKCSDPPKVVNGKYICSNDTTHKPNDVCHLQCDNRYKPNTNNPEMICQLTETWSTPPVCVEKMCDALPTVPHGKYTCNTTTFTISALCKLECDDDYMVGPGNSSIYCQESETWTASASCILM